MLRYTLKYKTTNNNNIFLIVLFFIHLNKNIHFGNDFKLTILFIIRKNIGTEFYDENYNKNNNLLYNF